MQMTQNYHLQATGIWCYVGGAWINSLSYADDMVLLPPTVSALQTILQWRYVAHMLDLMTLYTTQRNSICIYAGPTKAIRGSVLDKSQARK